MAADLSVVIVNYRSGALLADAIASVRAHAVSRDSRPAEVEVVVVDNDSGPQDEPFLSTLPAGTSLLRNRRNLGFAAGCNQGAAASEGELLCFLNPDARLLPGALQALLEELTSRPEIGAVGPAFWADDDCSIRLPSTDLPTLRDLLLRRLIRRFPPLAQGAARRWIRRVLVLWNTIAPTDVAMLAGACLVTRRATWERIGPFDPQFFLYFEDADWCRRARSRGLRLRYVPTARVVHYLGQSAKTLAVQAGEWTRVSEARYITKHFGRVAEWLVGLVDRWAESRGGGPAKTWPVPVIDLGALHEPPLLTVSATEPIAFQLAYHWLFVPAASAFPERPTFQLSSSVWARLLPARYFARAVSLRSGLPVQAWTWVKMSE